MQTDEQDDDDQKRRKMRCNGVFVHEYIIVFNLGARASHHTLVDCRQERKKRRRTTTPQAQ